MARTWTLVTTLSVASSSTFLPWSRALVHGSSVYFVRNVTSGNNKIYAWDGVNITDIAAANFPEDGAASGIGDICVFDGDLFCAYGNNPTLGAPTSIYRWNGGTSWTNEYTLEDESPPGDGWIAAGIAAVDSWVWPMDCDANYMAIAGSISNINTETFRRMWTRDTSGNYAINQMPGSVYPAPGYQLVGRSKGSDYSGIVGFNRLSATDFQPILRGTPWANLTGAGIGARIPIGYGEGFSFFSHNTSGTYWELKYSNDWGSSLFTAGGLTQTETRKRAIWKFKNLGGGVIMLGVDSTQAYTWDSDLNNFVADGTTGQTIQDYFILNGTLYALTSSGVANSVEMWSAGSVGCQASFYYGIEIPTLASALPFCVNPGGLAISATNIMAVLGTGGPAGLSVVYQTPPYNGAWTDISGIVPTGSSVTSVKFI